MPISPGKHAYQPWREANTTMKLLQAGDDIFKPRADVDESKSDFAKKPNGESEKKSCAKEKKRTNYDMKRRRGKLNPICKNSLKIHYLLN